MSSNNKKNKNKDNNIISLGKDVELIIYDKSGRQLELSYCKDEEITINKYIGDLPYIILDQAKDLNQKGIDIFDESDPFYNDICFLFNNLIKFIYLFNNYYFHYIYLTIFCGNQ